MAYKVFSNGNALNASELNTYLMNQSVISFATTTARDAALTSPVEGQLVWLEDSNKYVYYTGSAWADLITPASTTPNPILNSAFDIWQRGSSFSNPASGAYVADRWFVNYSGTGATRTISLQSFVPGAAPVSGYEASGFMRYALSAAGSGNTANEFGQRIEDVRQFANQTATISFWAKADAARNVTFKFVQNFGTGGSTAVETSSTTFAITTSWARYTATFTIPSISGKTVGAGSNLQAYWDIGVSPTTFTFDIWGVQLESGSTASAFTRNGSNFQAELSACQRYFQMMSNSTFSKYGIGTCVDSTTAYFAIQHITTMRSAPTLTFAAASNYYVTAPGVINQTAATIATSGSTNSTSSYVFATFSSNGNFAQGRAVVLESVNANGTIQISAEL